jgi:hypothetical protein
MTRYTGFRAALLSAVLVPVVVACGDTTAPLVIMRPTLTLSATELTLDAGQKQTLTVTVTNATNPAVIWRSASDAIVTVSQTGEVTAVAPGQALVTALSAEDSTARASALVTVRTPPLGNPLVLPSLGLGSVAERYTAEVAVRGSWAYTSTWGNRGGAAGNAVKIWNVSGNTPVLTDSLIISAASTTGDVQISDDGALLVVATEFSPGSIVIFDRSNPAKPVQLSRFSSANTTPGVHTVKLGRVNNRHYAFLSVDPGGVPATLVIVDITNPSQPQQVFAQAMGQPYVHDVFVRDGILFAALWNQGFRIFDIGGGNRGGSPSAPVVIGNGLTQTGQIHNLWWFHDPQTSSKR